MLEQLVDLATPHPVQVRTDARARAGHSEVTRSSRESPMLVLTILVPALLFAVGTVGLAVREERALGLRPIRRP